MDKRGKGECKRGEGTIEVADTQSAAAVTVVPFIGTRTAGLIQEESTTTTTISCFSKHENAENGRHNLK